MIIPLCAAALAVLLLLWLFLSRKKSILRVMLPLDGRNRPGGPGRLSACRPGGGKQVSARL